LEREAAKRPFRRSGELVLLEALDSGARRAPEEDDDAEEVGEGEAEARRFRKSFWLKARGLARCWFAKGWAESPADDEPASDWSDEVDEDDLRRAEEPPKPKEWGVMPLMEESKPPPDDEEEDEEGAE
jgi:hypothetical protein